MKGLMVSILIDLSGRFKMETLFIDNYRLAKSKEGM